MSLGTFLTDDRAVSEVVSYMLSLSILLLVVTSIGVAGNQHMDEITDKQTAGQIEGFGQQTAYEVQFVDRSVRSDSSPSSAIARSIELPARTVGQSYTIEIEPEDPSAPFNPYKTYLITVSSGTGATVEVPVESQTPVQSTSVESGPIEIIRPQPTEENVESGVCEFIEGADGTGTNGQDYGADNGDGDSSENFESYDDVRDHDNIYEPDTCKITIVEAN
jgi:hypothetical protein